METPGTGHGRVFGPSVGAVPHYYGKLVGNGMVWKPLVVAMVGIWYKL